MQCALPCRPALRLEVLDSSYLGRRQCEKLHLSVGRFWWPLLSAVTDDRRLLIPVKDALGNGARPGLGRWSGRLFFFGKSFQAGGGPKLLEQPRDVVATLPAARRTFDAQHVELADRPIRRSFRRWACGSLPGSLCGLPALQRSWCLCEGRRFWPDTSARCRLGQSLWRLCQKPLSST